MMRRSASTHAILLVLSRHLRPFAFIRGFLLPNIGLASGLVSKGWKSHSVAMNWGTVRVVAAVVLLLDASFGLWNHERFLKTAPKINIFRIAMVEAAVALLLLIVHVLF